MVQCLRLASQQRLNNGVNLPLRLVANRSHAAQGAKGFTLLEVLIAIMITAMIGLGAWQILESAIQTNDKTQLRFSQLNALQKAMLIMGRDFEQITPRSVRDEYGDYMFALTNRGEFSAVEFTRNGWRNPLNDKRSNLQRVAYELDGETLVRHYWFVLDRAQDSKQYTRNLLRGVIDIKFSFMDDAGNWSISWPKEDASSASNKAQNTDRMEAYNQLPKALKLELNTRHFGKLERVFPIVDYLSGIVIDTTNQQNNNGQSNNGTGTNSTNRGAN